MAGGKRSSVLKMGIGMALVELRPGFWHVRTQFKVLRGLIDLGNHMALVRLSSGSFVAIDAVEPDASLKQAIDDLTDGGEKLEAVLATHPFHTLGFPGFYKHYPNAKYYGTPRHLRRQTDIPWAGSIDACETRRAFEPDLDIRVPPTGACEFDNPKPPATNHFANAWVFHKPSKVAFNDDMVILIDSPWSKMSPLVWLFGYRHDTLRFHTSFNSVAFRNTPEAPRLFAEWFESLCNDWDIEVLCTAHNGIVDGDACQRMRTLLEESRPALAKLSAAAEAAAEGKGSVEGRARGGSIDSTADPTCQTRGDECG